MHSTSNITNRCITRRYGGGKLRCGRGGRAQERAVPVASTTRLSTVRTLAGPALDARVTRVYLAREARGASSVDSRSRLHAIPAADLLGVVFCVQCRPCGRFSTRHSTRDNTLGITTLLQVILSTPPCGRMAHNHALAAVLAHQAPSTDHTTSNRFEKIEGVGD